MVENSKNKVLKHDEQQQLPEEMVEEILLNLPVKSLLRFSSVSKAWNSMIFESRMVKRYRGRRREKYIARSEYVFSGADNIPTFPVSSVGVGVGVGVGSHVVCPFGVFTRVIASCEELWLASSFNDESLYLWNPSMGTYKKLPNPSMRAHPSYDFHNRGIFLYGLGYDSLVDDYKILKVSTFDCELYSLRSDTWREVPNLFIGLLACNTWSEVPNFFSAFPDDTDDLNCVNGDLNCVNGNLNWLSRDIIRCFDLSTHKIGEVAQPSNYYCPTSIYISEGERRLDVLNGMLCVTLHYNDQFGRKCIVWVMEDYGDANSWTEKLSISGSGSRYYVFESYHSIRPLYFYQNGDILLLGQTWGMKDQVFMYNKDDKTTQKILETTTYDGKIYVDSLVKLDMIS